MLDQQHAAALLAKYADGTATEAERAVVERWYESEAVRYGQEGAPVFEHLENELWAGTLQRAGLTAPARRRRLTWTRVAAAAAAIIVLTAGAVWFYKNNRHAASSTLSAPLAQQVLPGSNKAVLTLGNGSTISLSDAATGELAQQGGTRISKTDEGQLVYDAGSGGEAGKHNTISTPRGGQFRIDLPDGTRVWLNAASALTFPASFAGLDERRVELSGEAYFEVARDAARPFRVTSRQQTIEVLGTAFNINAYTDEPESKTTLVSGAVKVNGSMLRPGQQAVSYNGGVSVRNAETDMETAWKNGEFIFNGQDFKTVMRMVARWYDVDVIYEYEPKQFRIGGEVSRSRHIGEVLKMISVTGGVQFKVEGKTVRVIR